MFRRDTKRIYIACHDVWPCRRSLSYDDHLHLAMKLVTALLYTATFVRCFHALRYGIRTFTSAAQLHLDRKPGIRITAVVKVEKSDVKELYVSFGQTLKPPTGGCGRPSVFMKFEVWERWMSIIGGVGTAFPCVRPMAL